MKDLHGMIMLTSTQLISITIMNLLQQLKKS